MPIIKGIITMMMVIILIKIVIIKKRNKNIKRNYRLIIILIHKIRKLRINKKKKLKNKIKIFYK